jgi:cell division protein ZapA
MPTLEVTVNGRRHQLSCAEGEEPRLRRLAAYVDGRVAELAKQHGQVGDARLLVLASLLIADELADAYDEVKRLRAAAADNARQGERQAIEAMEHVAARLEQLAAALTEA